MTLRLDEPTSDELDAARRLAFKSLIRIPGPPSPDQLIMLPTRLDAVGWTPEQLFVFLGQASNTRLDTYFTRMTVPTLEHFQAQATEGRALLLGHDWGGQPVGYSFLAALEEDQTTDPDQGGLDSITRLLVNYFIPRGQGTTFNLSTDQIIENIVSTAWRDLSVGFIAGQLTCSICGRDMMTWDCEHIPGVTYPVEVQPGQAQMLLAFGWIEQGELLETSFGFKGATPDAAVMPTRTKARLVAAHQRLTAEEATQLSALQVQTGTRIVDPDDLRAARSYSTPAKQKESLMTARTKVPGTRQEAPPPDAAATSDVTTAVADQATQESQSYADAITNKNSEIANQQALIDAKTQEITALGQAVDGTGQPVDNSALIAVAQVELETLQAQMLTLQADLVVLQDLQAAASTAAEGTGGTATPPPEPGAAPPGAPPVDMAQTARGVLTQMTRNVQLYLAPLRAMRSRITRVHLDQARFIARELNALLEAGGETPVRYGEDDIIFKLLERTIGGKPSISQVGRLMGLASDGEKYRKALVDEAVRCEVNLFGQKVNEEASRRKYERMSTTDLEGEIAKYDGERPNHWSAGRSVMPNSAVVQLQPTTPSGSPASPDAQPGTNGHVSKL